MTQKEQEITAADEWFRGEDRRLLFPIVDKEGTPVNMDGWGLRWDLRESASDTALIVKTTGNGEIEIEDRDGEHDQARVKVDHGDYQQVPGGDYYQKLYRTDEDVVTVLAYGPVTIREATLEVNS